MANRSDRYGEPLTAQKVNEKSLIRATLLLALAQVAVIAAMLVLMFTPYAKVVFVCAVPYIMLYVYYIRGADTMTELCCRYAKLFRLLKWISPLLFAVAFVLAIFA